MVAFEIWSVVHGKLYRMNPDFVYLTLRVVGLLYMVPIGYLLIQTTWRKGYLQQDGLWQLHFSLTGEMKLPLALLVFCWLGVVLVNIGKFFGHKIAWNNVCRGDFPEDDEVAIEEFARIKKELKVHRRIRLYRNDLLQSPIIRGVFFVRIILPYQTYSREQLAVIYYHELTHYKGHDLRYKVCARIAWVLSPMHGAIGRLIKLVDEWSEYHCDTRAVAAMGGKGQGRRYFGAIIQIAETSRQIPEMGYIFSGLFESGILLERRIEHMKKYNEYKRAAKGVSVALALAFVIVSVTPVYAAGTQLSRFHDFIYKNVENTTEYDVAEDALEVHYIPAEEDDTYTELVYAYPEQEYIMPVLNEDEVVSFTWTVTPGTRHVSSKFYVKAGQKISTSATITPAGVTYWLGIMDSDGDVWYVTGTSSIAYTFPISSSDYYRVLVQNQGSQNITASGAYSYYTP